MSKRGFTRIEMLLVIAIIATLAAILFPVFAKTRERARSASCQTNLFNIGMALRLYSQDHEGRYPPQANVLDPLYPNYLPLSQSLVCPSGESPAGQHLPPQPPGAPEAMSPPGMGGPSGLPPGQPPVEEAPSTLLRSSYYYHAGLRHAPSRLFPLVADDAPRHNARANVLFTDGSLQLVPGTEWYLLWEPLYPAPPPPPRPKGSPEVLRIGP